MKITITTPEIKELERQLAEEKDRAEAWELRCEELEQELRDAQAQLDESVRKEARLGLEAGKLRKRNDELTADLKAKLYNQTVVYEKEIRELRDRIGEQNWTIGCYDQENRELREKLAKAEAELDECRKDKNRLMDECTELGKRLLARPITVSLNEWASVIHENAVAHGWWAQGVCDGGDFRIDGDVDRPLPEILMLCVCELAESMEEYRDGKPLIYEGENGKPEGIAVEMVDCIIRILDWMGHNGVDVDEMIKKKHAYNLGRPYRHGGKIA